MEQEEKWMKNKLFWENRLTKFFSYIEMSLVDPEFNKELLLDILQNLFSENVSVGTKIQLVLFVQQQVQFLIDNIDSAEQVFGSLLNIYNYFGNHLIMLKSEVLVTLTVICVQFDLKDNHKEFVTILLDTVLKVNIGHPLIRRTCSECLCMLEDVYEGMLSENLQSLLATSLEERSFATSSHVVLVGNVFNHVTQIKQKNAPEIEENHSGFDMNKCSSFLVKEMSTLSPTGLLRLVPKVLPCLEYSQIPRSVLGTMLMYSSQSWNLVLLYVSIHMQNSYPSLFQQLDTTWLMSIILKLLMLKDLQQLPYGQRQIVQYWVQNYVERLPPELKAEACSLALSILEPNLYDHHSTFNSKLDCIAYITKNTSSNWLPSTQLNVYNCLVRHAQYTKERRETSVLFHGLYELYEHGDDEYKEKVLKLVEDLTIYTLRVVPYTIDFCDSIDALCDGFPSCALLKNITQHLLRFNMKDIFLNTKFYLRMIEKVVLAPEICPMVVVEKFKHISRTSQMKDCTWETGNLLLSICRNILKTSKLPQVRYDVACLLWNVSQTFENNNICDRALFLYLVIGNVSPAFYEDVLVASNSSNKNEEESNKLIDANPTKLQGSLVITHIKTNFLLFSLLPQPDELCTANTLAIDYSEDILTSYRSALSADEFDRNIYHMFTLTFDDSIDSSPNKIFAINVNVTTTGPFETINDSSWPFMIKKCLQDRTSKGEVCTLCFTPKEPRPSIFDVSASYVDEDDQCCMVNLLPFQLKFKDLFKPLTFLEREDDELRLFNTLWKYISENESSLDERHALSICNLGKATRDDVETCLDRFIITTKDDHLYVGIYLPPTNHVLLIFVFHEDNTNVKIATDDYMLLDEINEFIDNLKVD